MRKVFLLFLVSVLIYSCDKTRPYELVGAEGRKPFYPEVPTGMTYIPAGGFTMGLHEQDMMQVDDARAKVVTISAFYMDQTEISNNEYRQFVEWVKDSIALEKLVDRGLRDQMDEYINFDQEILFSIKGEGDELKLANYYYDNKSLDFSKISADGSTEDESADILPDDIERDGRKVFDVLFADFNRETTYPLTAREVKKDWLGLNWNSTSSFNMWDNPQLMPLLSDMYYSAKERYYKRREIDIRQLVFEYYWIDYKEA
ncbi:MAG: formylglycine-generating enzyme family protein, partial [Bacteroidota bacterium]